MVKLKIRKYAYLHIFSLTTSQSQKNDFEGRFEMRMSIFLFKNLFWSVSVSILKSQKMDFQGLWTLSFLPSKWDYWEIGQLNKLFLFVKDIGNIYIFAWESKKFMLFLNVFCDFQYFLKIVFTHFTSHCPKCLFHMNNHKDPAGWVISVERSSR